jgi:predicted transport protein
MDLYKLDKAKLEEIKNKPFRLERDIQNIFEQNLDSIFALQLVKSEFIIKNKRIDTLAFDETTKGFVIIEYKKDRNISIVDQGFAYLSLMLQNKAEFIIEHNENLNKGLKRNEIDWSQCRVIFVAPSFTENQKLSSDFQDIAIELWEVKKYENDIIGINQIKKSSRESIKQISGKDESRKAVTREIKVFTEADHMEKGSEEMIELYNEIKSRILELNEVEISPTKFYIGFKLRKKVITDVELQRKQLRIRINLKKGQLDDPRNLFDDVSNKGHWGLGDYEAKINTTSDIDYLMSFIKQAYNFYSA